MEHTAQKPTTKGSKQTVAPVPEPVGEQSMLSRVTFRVLSALLLVMAFALAFHEIRDLDVGFHLKAGDWILENMKFPGKDVFTYTINDTDYIDLYWFYQVVLSIANSLGGSLGIVLLHAGLVVVNFYMIIRRTQQLGAVRVLSYGIVLFTAIYAASYHFTIRPHIFSWTFLNLLFLTLESYYADRRTKLWPLPVIMLIWANSHTLFILGWVLFFCYFVGISWEQKKIDKNLFKYAAIAVAVCFINPYFFQGVLLPIQQFGFLQSGNVYNALISEYKSPFAGSMFATYTAGGSFVLFQPTFFFHLFLLMALAAAVVRFLVVRDRRVHDVLLFVLFSFIMATAFKNIGYFVIALTPYTIRGMGYIFSGWEKPKNQRYSRLREKTALRPAVEKTFLWVNAGLIVVTIVCTLRVFTNAYYTAWRSRDVTGYRMSSNNMPIRSAEFLRDNGLDARILNHINFGGIYEYYLPQPVFIDARNEIIGEKFFREYRRMDNDKLRPGLLDKYRPEIIAFPHRVELDWLEYFRTSPDWRLVLADDISTVYLRNSYARGVPAIDSVSFLAQQKIPITAPGAIDGVLELRRDPGFLSSLTTTQYYPNVELDLSSFAINNKWYSSAVQVGLEGLRKGTVDTPELYYNIGQGFIHTGDYERAKYCYERYLEANENPKLERLVEKLTKILESRAKRRGLGK